MDGALKYRREIDTCGESSVAQLLRWIKPSSSVLEMGPATGMMTKLLQSEKHCDIVCIEIDPTAAKEAAQYCRKMVVGDLSSVDWERAIEGERFDYITFADVLEHLSDPLTVLRRALNFLKPEGEVLISVPNIGYVGVIAELLEGRFDYRRDGLLDETHLHFFTRESLVELITQVGLVGTEWSRTAINPEFSEFRLKARNLGAATRGVLSSVPDGDTYQFLVRCSKSGIAASRDNAEPCRIHRLTGLTAQVYFDTGRGFAESESIVIPLSQLLGQQVIQCHVPPGVKVIRVDPVDALLPFALSHILVKSQDSTLFEWRSAQGPLAQRSGFLNLNELYASGMSVLIPHSEDPAVTIVVDCPDGADFTAGVELDGAAAVEGIFRSLREDASLQAKEISSLSATLSESELQLDLYKKDLESHKLKLSSSESGRCQAEEALNVLVRSSSWRLTRPLRVGKRLLKAVSRYLARRIKSRIKAAVVSSESLLRSRFSAHIWRLFDLGTEYELRVAKVGPSARELTEMREQSFSKRGPVFSVIMPTYKTKPMWLKEAIESVRSQAYPFWELCIADDASDDPAIRSLLTTYAASDPRIKFVFLSENGHISRASNAALDLATGEFVVLLDHDDLLAPHALYRLSEAINKTPDVDVLYSDEDKVSLTGVRFEPTCKPAWSPEYFLSFMYTGHISAFRVALVREVGGFREGLEGSQDYDLMLRMTERSNRVLHVPDVLYHWRVHQDSVAANLDCKPYAFAAAKRAILDALVRRGFTSASVDDSRSRGLYVTRRNAATDLSAIIAVGDVSQGLKGEVVKVAEGDVVTICGEIDKLELADSAVVCVVEGASFKEEGSQTLLDYFCDPAIGIVAPRIVDSDGELMAAGAYYSQGEIKPHFKGAQSSDVGYRARLVVPFNVSFVYPQCFFLRAGLLRTLPQAITSTSELALAVALEARRRGLRCVIDPSVQAIQTTGCAIPEVSRDRVGMLMAHYGIQQFKDPFLPAGLPRYQGVQEMPNS